MIIYFKVFLTLLTVVATFVLYYHPILAMTNGDLGFHYLVGKMIVATKHVPTTNLFSYAFPNFSWIDNHWGTEVFFYELVSHVGFTGLLISTSLLSTFSFFLLFLFSIKRYNPLLSFFAFLLYFQILIERIEIRPELFSFLFTSVFLFILFKNREKTTRWIYILVFIQLIWVNVHILFPLGPALISFFIIDEILFSRNLSFKNSNPIKSDPKLKNLVVLLILCLGVTVVNPNGILGALFPLTFYHNYGYGISEDQNIIDVFRFQNTTPATFLVISTIIFSALLVFNFFLKPKKFRYIDVILFIFFSAAAFYAERNISLFAIGTFISFCYLLNNLTGSFFNLSLKKALIFLLIFFGVVIYIFSVKSVTDAHGFGSTVIAKGKGAADFYLNNNLKGPIFNDFDIGSYLDYRLYPKDKVLVDGRPEAYPVSFFQQFYIPAQKNIKNFDEAANYYHYNSIVFSHTDQADWAHTFIPQILKDKNWVLVYLDSYAFVMLKNNPQNATLINKYKITQNNFKLPPNATLGELAGYSNFFIRAGWNKQEMQAETAYLRLNPTNCDVLYHFSNQLINTNNSKASYYAQKWQLTCN